MTKGNRERIEIHDPFKPPAYWQDTGIRPALEKQLDGKILFIFPYCEEILNSIEKFSKGAGSPNLFDYVRRYKILRNEMYLLKGARDE